MNILVNILWITGIWFFIWGILYLISQMAVEVVYHFTLWVEKKRKYIKIVTILAILSYVIQLIDYLFFISGNKLF